MSPHRSHPRRTQVGQSVADHLITAENTIDEAIVAVANLGALLPQARKDLRLACEVGHQAFDDIGTAFQQLIVARGFMIKTHQALKVTGDQVGLGEVNFGGLYGKPTALASAASEASVGGGVEAFPSVREAA